MNRVDVSTVHVRFEQNHMATKFDLCVAVAPERVAMAERALAEALSEIGRLERLLSEFLPESPVFALNRAEPGNRVELSEEAIELLDLSARMEKATRGAFDCTAKSLPSENVCGLVERIGWDRQTGQAWRLDRNARLGFGAIGKGYALDRVRSMIERAGFSDFVLSAGGSSIVLSGFADRVSASWEWAWSWGKDPDGSPIGQLFLHRDGKAVALGISGFQEQGAHIKTALPTPGAVSALVAHPSAAEADALSTALFAAGWEASRQWVEHLLGDVGTAVIDDQQEPRWNGVFRKLWGEVRTSAPRSPATGPSLPGSVFASLVAWSAMLWNASVAFAEEVIDLAADGGAIAESFTPYVFDRDPIWIALPAFAALVLLVHLKRIKTPKRKKRSITG